MSYLPLNSILAILGHYVVPSAKLILPSRSDSVVLKHLFAMCGDGNVQKRVNLDFEPFGGDEYLYVIHSSKIPLLIVFLLTHIPELWSHTSFPGGFHNYTRHLSTSSIERIIEDIMKMIENQFHISEQSHIITEFDLQTDGIWRDAVSFILQELKDGRPVSWSTAKERLSSIECSKCSKWTRAYPRLQCDHSICFECWSSEIPCPLCCEKI